MRAPTLSRTVAERVTDALRSRILTGRYPPGTPLRQDAVANDLGVSRIPLREALNHLEAEGLVQGIPHRGFLVRATSRTEASEVFRLRLQLEPVAVAEGAQMASNADHEEAAQALDQLEHASRRRSESEAAESNRNFLLSLVVPHRRPLTVEVLSRLHSASQRYISLHLNKPGGLRDLYEGHAELLALWRERRAEDCARAVSNHIARVQDRVLMALAD